MTTSGLRLRNESHPRLNDVTPGTASRDLKHAVDAGLLIAHGEKRGRCYTAADEIRALRRALTAVRA